MTSRMRTGKSQKIRDVERLNALEVRMGRLSSLLSEVAEALSEYPDGLKLSGGGLKPLSEARPDALVVNAREWPSIDEIEKILAAWHAIRRKLATAAPAAPRGKKRFRH